MEFKPIKNYEGYYEISQEGVVRSIKRDISCFKAGSKSIEGKVLKPFLKNGNPYYQLRKPGIKKNKSLKSLLAETWGTI